MNYNLEKGESQVDPLLDAHVVETVPDADQVAVGTLVLAHEVLHLLQTSALPLLVGVDLLPQTQLPVPLLENHLLLLGNQVFHTLQLPVQLLPPPVSTPQTVLHHTDVLLQRQEVVSQHGQLLLEGAFGVLGVVKLQLEVRDGPAFLCLDIEQDVDLRLHFYLVAVELLLQFLQFLISELLTR